jgi:formylglycine-generating enzyme required for sulfatase activity
MCAYSTVIEPGKFLVVQKKVITGYAMLKYPVTRGVWQNVKEWGNDHGYELHSELFFPNVSTTEWELPINGVSWLTAVLWCNAASEQDGMEPVYFDSDGNILRRAPDDYEEYYSVEDLDIRQKIYRNGFRLPTFLEWRIAALGGDPDLPDWKFKFAGGGDLAKVGWYGGEDGSGNCDDLRDVRILTPNRLGLYDMCGNVCEMTSANEHMGGAWSSPEDECAIFWDGQEEEHTSGETGDWIGFRPVYSEIALNEEQALDLVQKIPQLLQRIPENLKTENVCLTAVKKDEKAMNGVPEPLKERIKRLLQNGETHQNSSAQNTPSADSAAPPPLVKPDGPDSMIPPRQNQPPVQYYAGIDGRQAGPFDWAELDMLVKKGVINGQTLVWKAGFAGWIPAAESPDLKIILGS